MQRREPEGVVISCDYCGTDWDEVLPMIEGHQGSVVCLECLKRALEARAPQDQTFACTMCLRERPAGTVAFKPPPAEGANPEAMLCESCIDQAAKAFDRDPDVDWKRPR